MWLPAMALFIASCIRLVLCLTTEYTEKIFLEKLIVVQIVQKPLAFYVTWRVHYRVHNG